MRFRLWQPKTFLMVLIFGVLAIITLILMEYYDNFKITNIAILFIIMMWIVMMIGFIEGQKEE